jgi:pimeloyl-ACP methyl ester carboxylesterase
MIEEISVGTKHKAWAPLVVAAIGLGAPSAQAQSDEGVVGTWRGILAAGPQRLEMVFNVTRDADGALTGTMDVPAQGLTGFALTTVTYADGTVTMTFAVPGGGHYQGELNESGDGISGTFTQAGQGFPMELGRSTEGPPTLVRPQEPKPPYPYVVESVTFASTAAGVELAGTLTLPEGEGPFPAAILVSGSGPQDRDEALMGHKPFHVLADHLTRNGIAVLRYDDRGVAESSGDFATATTSDFATDALAAIAHLRKDPRVTSDAIGIVGHSEGGVVGPLAASRSDAVGYVVMLAGTGVPGLDVLVEQGRLIGSASGTAPAITELNARVQTRLAAIVEEEPDSDAAAIRMRAAMREEIGRLDPQLREAAGEALGDQAIDQSVAQMNSPWFRYFLVYDPRPALEQTTVPVLALFGEKDLQVPPAQSAGEVEAALVRGGNEDVTIHILPGLNHLFQEAESGSPTEYQQIEQTFSPAALEIVSRWITEHFGSGAQSSER